MNFDTTIQPAYSHIIPIFPSLVDDARLMVRIKWASGLERDADGDLTEIGGLDMSRHRLAPVVALEHFKSLQLPIGKTEDEKGNYTVHLDPVNKVALADVYFFKGEGEVGKIAKEVFEMVRQGTMRGASFGYMINHAVGMPDGRGKHLLSVLVTELSIVAMPMNPSTVRSSLPSTHAKLAA